MSKYETISHPDIGKVRVKKSPPVDTAKANSVAVKREHAERVAVNNRYFGLLMRVLVLIAFAIFFIRIVWRLRGGDDALSFSGFLDWLSNLNSIDISVNISDFFIAGDWGWFEFFRNFLNFFGKIFGVLVWLFSNLFNLGLYLISFIVFLLR